MAFFITGLTTVTVKHTRVDCLLYLSHKKPKHKPMI